MVGRAGSGDHSAKRLGCVACNGQPCPWHATLWACKQPAHAAHGARRSPPPRPAPAPARPPTNLPTTTPCAATPQTGRMPIGNALGGLVDTGMSTLQQLGSNVVNTLGGVFSGVSSAFGSATPAQQNAYRIWATPQQQQALLAPYKTELHVAGDWPAALERCVWRRGALPAHVAVACAALAGGACACAATCAAAPTPRRAGA